MAETTKGLLDTSVVIDHDVIDPALLPDESAISAITLAERAARIASNEPLPNGTLCLSRGTRPGCTVEPLSARRPAHCLHRPVYTRNPSDFATFKGIVKVVTV